MANLVAESCTEVGAKHHGEVIFVGGSGVANLVHLLLAFYSVFCSERCEKRAFSPLPLEDSKEKEGEDFGAQFAAKWI